MRGPSGAFEWLASVFIGFYLVARLNVLALEYPLPGVVLTLIVPAVGLAVLLLAPKGAVGRAPISIPLLGYVIWTASSVAWTIDRDASLFRVRNEILSFTLFVLVVGVVSPRVTVRALEVSLAAIAAWTVYALVAIPGTMSTPSATSGQVLDGWRGTFLHKNLMGMAMLYGLCLVLTLERNLRVRWLLGIVFAALMIGSQSATVVSGGLAVLLTWAWVRSLSRRSNPRERMLFVLLTVAGIALIFAIAFGSLPAILGLYGKDLTFTGRTEIWSGLWYRIAERPLHGWGIDAPWADWNSMFTSELHRRIGFKAAHSHNGAVEILLQFGLVGLILFTIFLASVFRAGWRSRVDRRFGDWALLTCVAIVTTSLSEVVFTGGYLALLAAAWVCCSRPEVWNHDQSIAHHRDPHLSQGTQTRPTAALAGPRARVDR